MMLRAIWRLSIPGTFIPNRVPGNPTSWAESWAAIADDDHAALAEGEGQTLGPAGGRDLFPSNAVDGGVGELQEGDAPRRSLE